MKWKQTIKEMAREKGYCVALVVCLAAVVVSGWLFVRSLRDTDQELAQPEAVQAAVLPTLPKAVSAAKPVPEAPAQPVSPQNPALREDEEPQTPAEALQPSDDAPVAASEAPVRAAAALSRPVEGEVVLGYSMDRLSYNPTTRDWRTHAGLDLAAPEGSEVRAAAEGTVLSVYADELLGQTVTVEHSSGVVTHYSNLAEAVAVSAGDHVSAGQTLGTVGRTALGELGSEPHLHFAVYKNNVPQDPSAYLAG